MASAYQDAVIKSSSHATDLDRARTLSMTSVTSAELKAAEAGLSRPRTTSMHSAEADGLRQRAISVTSAELKATEAGVIAVVYTAEDGGGGVVEEVVVDDPWNIVGGIDDGDVWSELSIFRKILRVIWIAVRLIIVVGLLYCFVCSLDALQDSFQLVGGRSAGALFTSSLITNPVCGLMIGVLVTVLVQSSSTSTSIVVSMVGSGLLDVKPAIPIIMGSNIGTTVTNTLVAMTQSIDRQTFRRAFAGATGYLYYMTLAMVKGIHSGSDSEAPMFLKVITEPLTKMICQIDKKVITAIAEESDRQKFPVAKYYCKEVKQYLVYNITGANDTQKAIVDSEQFSYEIKMGNMSGYDVLSWTHIDDENSTKCDYLFHGVGTPGALSEGAAGAILMVGALLTLILCLLIMVKILNSLLRGPMAKIVRRSINSSFPGKFAFLTGYVAILIGAGVTVLVQSSSVFTSALTPLVGLGVVTIERMYPLTLGSNIGTTITSILAALTADAAHIQYTLQISFCHLFFNITGILIWYPIPFMRHVPIRIAKYVGTVTSEYRWFAIVYIVAMFLLLPLFVFALSLGGLWVMLGVGIPIIVLIIAVCIINLLQTHRPNWLPKVLRDWMFLPAPLRSLAPYDEIFTSCCCCCKAAITTQEGEQVETAGSSCCSSCSRRSSSGSSTTLELSHRGSGDSSASNADVNCIKVTPLGEGNEGNDIIGGYTNRTFVDDV